MCRLLGISYGSEQEDLTTSEIACILFSALVKGGPHAFGFMSYQDGGEIQIGKSPGRCDTPDAQAWLAEEIDDDARWFVGHTRYATHGDPLDNRNNHPIQHGDIVGVHNGVLKGWEKIIDITGREVEGTEVDSEAIFAAVNRWGPSAGMRRIFGSAVTFYANVERPHVLHLARTEGRSVSIGWTAKGNLIWASEESALMELAKAGIEFVNLSRVSENRLLLIRNGKIIQRHRFRPIERKVIPTPAPKLDESKRLQRALSAGYGSGASSLGFEHDAQARLAERRGRKLFPKGKPARKQGKPKDKNRLVFYKGNFITVDEYVEIISN